MKKSTIIRTVILVLALINQILTTTGHPIIPVGEEEISVIITVLASLWAWWKNNSFTPEAQEADCYLERLKEGGV